ncbi:MAG: HAMP domain-containing sensor histidine kinase [Rhodocyclaceae bacterium]|nr:HAMP domain-containing sensor histidine kinase [Rhodocyclaceae bacterium]
MSRFSYRQLLLCAFVALALLVSLPTLRGLWVAEGLVAAGHRGQERALWMARDVRLLAEQARAMERQARQFLVLGREEPLARFEVERASALGILDRLNGVATELAVPVEIWRNVATGLDGAFLRRGQAAEVLAALARLAAINGDLAETARSLVARESAARQAALEAHRSELAWSLVAILAGALAAGLVLSRLLERPVGRLGASIDQLAQGRLAESIQGQGPREMQRLAGRLEALRVRLEALEGERARVLSHVSHELKTPLACLREGIAQFADGMAGPLSKSRRQLLPILQGGVVDLQRRIDDLMALQGVAHAARQLHRTRLDLAALAREVAAPLGVQGRGRGVRIDVTGKGLAHADRDQLRIVLTNLLANALAFSPQGGRVTLCILRRQDGVKILCADEGPGVEPAEAERIFEPFFRGSQRPAGLAPGSGVGLAMVREAVEAHGGRVWLAPEGPGAVFHVELPDGN